MGKYKNKKKAIELLKKGWSLEEKTNYKNKVMSYWMGKRGELEEHFFSKKTISELKEKKLIDENNMLIFINVN